jgi:hypothetical protein
MFPMSNKMILRKSPVQKTFMSVMTMVLLAGIPFGSFAGPREQAKRIYDRLAGVPPTETVLDAMEKCFSASPNYDVAACDAAGGDGINVADGAMKAAYIAMEDSGFYNVTLKNFVAPWTNEEQSVFVPLNDYTATVIGMIRDSDTVDFRQVLYGNILYVGQSTSPGYSVNNNQHYEAMENNNADLKTELVKHTQTQETGLPDAATAGVMTTRAAARAFFVDGTNRAMFRFTMINHLCTDLEPIKDVTRPPDRIRQDVSRSPGGDSRIFMNACVGCHSGMDPLVQAFAYYEWSYPSGGDPDTGHLVYDSTERPVDPSDPTKGLTRAQPKYLINSTNFPYGYVTRDDSWTNYWRSGPNALLGWNGAQSSGNGAKTMGQELANSDAFASCQVKKVFKTVCLRDPLSNVADRSQIDTMVSSFKTNGYNMKRVFAEAASYCKDGAAY